MTLVGTWNLENLFRVGGPSGPSSEADYAAKLNALATVIVDVKPDVLAVQEVGEPAALQDLVTEIGGTWHTYLADPDDRGIRVGFISRFVLTDVVQVSHFPDGVRPVQVDDTPIGSTRMGRPALQARLDVDGQSLDLITCHLKSKLLTFGDDQFSTTDEHERARFGVYALNRRAAEAATVREAATALLDGHGQERAVLVLGDLNDAITAATTQILYGPPGSEYGTDGFEAADKGDGQRMWNLMAMVPEDERFTRIYRGQPELIDHVLASHLVAHNVLEDDISITDTAARSITDDPNEQRDFAGSDHRPVFVYIDL